MKTIMEYLNLDFSFSESNEVVYIKQGDAGGGKEIAIQLYDAGERVEIGSGTVATLFASINGVVTANGDSCYINANVVYIPITDALSAVAGREHCEVRIKTNDKIVHTARFDILVGESAVNDGMPEYIPTASIISRIEALEQTVSPATSSEHEMYPVYTTNALHPEWTKSYITETVGNGTMYGTGGNNGYYRISKNAFDREKDGLLITRARNGASKFIASPYYILYSDADYFEEPEDIHGDTIVSFGNVAFDRTDTVRFWIYKKPTAAATSLTYGTTAGMSVGMTSGYQGTSEEG